LQSSTDLVNATRQREAEAVERARHQPKAFAREEYSPRSSSLQVNNSTPIQIPGSSNRHTQSYEHGRSYNDAASLQPGSLSRVPTASRHSNQGTEDPSRAARDTAHQYEEEDFRDFREWQRYRELRQKADTEAIGRRRDNLDDQFYEDDQTMGMSKLGLGKAVGAKMTRRHQNTAQQGDARTSSDRIRNLEEQFYDDDDEATGMSKPTLGQTVTAKATPRHQSTATRGDMRTSSDRRRREPIKSSRRVHETVEDSDSDCSDSAPNDSDDNVIGHKDGRPQDPRTGPKENTVVRPRERENGSRDPRERQITMIGNDRHREPKLDPRQEYSSSPRDSTTRRAQPTYDAETKSNIAQNYALSTSRGLPQRKSSYQDNDDDARRPRPQQGESYYNDDDQRRKKRHEDPAAASMVPNTGRRRDPNYIPGSDRRT
jgi:hypothetical protein